MQSETKDVVIGQFGAPHGVRGFIRVQSFTKPVKNLFDYFPWYIEQNKQWQTVKVKKVEQHAQKWVVKIEGINNRNEAQVLTGCKIAISRDELPKLDQNDYYWHDLIGLTVTNHEQKTLGTVTELLETGSNDVLVVVDEQKKKTLIPFLIGDFIQSIDVDNKIMTVDWGDDY